MSTVRGRKCSGVLKPRRAGHALAKAEPVPAAAAVPSPGHGGDAGPPLHAALDYCSRRLLAALDTTGGGRANDVGAGMPLVAQLSSASAELLRWWFSSDICRARVDNFHFAQRECILHVIVAHELLRCDDPALLYRRACDLAPPADAPTKAVDATYSVRLAPGGGGRWVMQALLVWWWAKAAAHRDAGNDSAASIGLRLIAATPGIRRQLQHAVFGHSVDGGEADVGRSSVLRHARLFLPPPLRAPFRAWLQAQHRDTALRIVEATSIVAPEGPALTLLATCGSNIGATPSTSRLRVELMLAGDAASAIADAPLERMIRRGAVKLPMLETTAHLRLPSLRATPPRDIGQRPKLSPTHRALLRAGIAAVARREPGFATLDPARRPRLLVLCEAPPTLRAARRFLIDNGFAPDAVAVANDCLPGDSIRAVLDALPARSTLADARVCTVVVLRTHRGGGDALAVAATGAASLWPEADFSEVRCENRERAMQGQAPRNLIDVLSIIEHPQCHATYAPLLRAGLATHGATAGTDAQDGRNLVIDDLAVATLREDAAVFDLVLPRVCGDSPQQPERLADLPRRIVRMRHALAVRKSVSMLIGCSMNDSGLRRAFLECAESDPEIESHCLVDPRRHATASREVWLAQGLGGRVWPDAVARTATRVYLVDFLPFCPTQPQPPDTTERMLATWLRRVNAQPSTQRAERIWCRATLPAPLFWSWKRSEGALSALLSTLTDAATAAPCGDFIP